LTNSLAALSATRANLNQNHMKTLPILYTGQQFRVIRNQAGMSVNKLAEMSGVARTQIYNFEGGTLNITVSTYRRLLNALAEFKSTQS